MRNKAEYENPDCILNKKKINKTLDLAALIQSWKRYKATDACPP